MENSVTVSATLIEAWEDPPQIGAGRPLSRADERPWLDLGRELRDKSGQWARLGAHLPLQTAYDIRTARLSPFRPAGTFEAVTRNAAVYARHVGEANR